MTHNKLLAACAPLAAFGIGRIYANRHGRAREVIESFDSHLVGEVLDVGAGASGPIFAAELGGRYHALELSASYKSISDLDRETVEHHVDLEKGGLPFQTGSFGTVMCLDVIEHVDDAHAVFRELFRVAQDRVIVSLPNNWPHFLWSLLAGRNITHTAGYGIGADPKVRGQRHKHFFNLEEAADFLLGAGPPEFECVELALRFEHGSDGLLSTCPGLTRYYRIGGKLTLLEAHERVGWMGLPAWMVAKIIYWPFRILDLLLTGCLYFWGSRTRFYNVGCRQVWAVFQRRQSSG